MRIGIARRVHAEWLENALVQKLPVRFAARLFYDDAEQIITGVIVRPSLARLKLKRQLEKHLEQFISRRSRLIREVGFENIKPVRHGDMILNAGRVGKQMPDCDTTPGFGCFGKIFCD